MSSDTGLILIVALLGWWNAICMRREGRFDDAREWARRNYGRSPT